MGLLGNVTVISGISGGSLLSALYAYGPPAFQDFDAATVALLRQGLQFELFRRALQPRSLAKGALASASVLAHGKRNSAQPRLRSANRTDALRAELAHRAFADRTVDQVTHPGLATVVTATDLRTTNAVRFGSLRSSCSAYGIIQDPITVAEAVAASAAFPALLPAIERTYNFTRPGSGETERHSVLLTDGGIYDNLGLSALEPKRSAAHTAHVYELDYIISCDAGAGRLALKAAHFAPARLRRSFDTAFRRGQDAARNKLHTSVENGHLSGAVHAYLGTPDNGLPIPVPDLIPAERVREYPTDFKAMSEADLYAISTRAEQLTRALTQHYCPMLT
jgi:NTE family protein